MSTLRHLEAYILSANKLKLDGIPTASIAVLENGKISAHVITQGSEDTETLYQCCSISKPITGLAVAKLVDQGRISYDDKIVDYLSKSTIDCIVNDQTAHLIEAVTIKMLLTHTSGLSQGGFPGYVNEPPPAECILSGTFPSNTPKVRFMSFPGAQFRYAGAGYILLELALEKITGLQFPELMQELVLKPLDMTRSHYGDLSSSEQNFTQPHVTGYTKADTTYHSFRELAAAGLWTTPTDLLKAISAVQESLHSDSGFLTQKTATQMLTPVIGDAAPLLGGMGLSWMANEAAFAHAGNNDPGYSSYFFGFRGKDARNGFAITTNSKIGHETAIMQIFSAVAYLKGWPRLKDLSDQFNLEDWVPFAAEEDVRADESWKEWVGRWDDGWEIIDEGGPMVAREGLGPMRLKIAAAPVAVLGHGKKEQMFVVGGMPLGMRFTWKDDERVIELMQMKMTMLHRR